MIDVLVVLLLSIVVEAVTEILTSSELTNPLRKKWKEWTYPLYAPPPDTFFQNFKVYFDKLISCGYCTSVWVAGFFGIWAPKFNLGNLVVDWLAIIFVLHRFSTLFHVIYELVRKGRVKTFDFEIQLTNRSENSEENNGSIRESTPEKSEQTEHRCDEAGRSSDIV